MANGRIRIRLVLAICIVLMTSSTRSAEVSWILSGSQVQPTQWSIEPQQPTDVDVIHFSGPTQMYLNLCQAEQTLGGRPTIVVYPDRRAVRLTFEPPAHADCTGLSQPVIGLKGSFGPLEPGLWEFYCNSVGPQFYREFDVRHAPQTSVCYVDPTAKGLNDGSSWANAFTRLQSALAVAESGCEVRVARGVYRPDWAPLFYAGDPNAAFHLPPGVVLKGGYAGQSWPRPNDRDVVAHESVLSGDLQGNDAVVGSLSEMLTDKSRLDNCYHVVVIDNADAATVLDGFTITGGVASGGNEPDDHSSGGGIFNRTGSPTIRNCLIIGNAANRYGGGIYNSSGLAPSVTGCTIADNWAQWRGGGLYNAWGAGLVVTKCLISGNGVGAAGGGMYSHIDGRLDVSNSIISGNVALNPTSGQGGALSGTAALVDLTYCTLVGNRATVGSSLACVASGGKGGQVSVNSCILWDEGDTVFVGDNALLQIDYSTVREGWHGSTNSAADPRFVQMGYWDNGGTTGDPADDTWFDGDYHLLWDSPCIEGGDPLLIPEAGETDLDGQPRLSGEIVDMGVYEVHNQPPVAVVGPWTTGFTLDGKAGDLTLNAGDSYDPEGLPLVYQWYLDGELVSRAVAFTTRLPMGLHPFKLIVSDSVGVSASVEGVAEIVKPVDTIATVSPSTITHRGTGSPITVSIVLPLGSRLSDFPPFEKLLLYPGGIEADHQIAFAWLGSKVLVVAKFDRAKFFEVAPTYGEVNVRVIGRLRDGSFFGSSNIVTLR